MQLLEQLGYRNIEVRIGDGYNGWPEAAPFDSIVATAAPAEVPKPLIDQLKLGGRVVIPAGPYEGQHLLIVEKRPDGTSTTKRTLPVRFVPLTRGGGTRSPMRHAPDHHQMRRTEREWMVRCMIAETFLMRVTAQPTSSSGRCCWRWGAR